MKAGLSFVALHELSRETQVAGGASSAAHLLKVAAKVISGCPSFGGQRTVASARMLENFEHLSKRFLPSVEAPSFEPISLPQWSWPGTLLQRQS